MDYEDEENNVPGNIPEFGAIFMSNAETKRECFERRVFALPQSQAGFVKHVKTGMLLFLFEFEKRQLFGVYKATSDGALNILPDAFISGGKCFPAQVCFSAIWLCSPLLENEFKSAIHENYYSTKKFKFGLTKDQVRRLLQLFSARKLKDRPLAPPRQVTEGVGRFSSKGRTKLDHNKFGIREDLEMQRRDRDFTPTVMSEYLENSEVGDTEADDMRFYTEYRMEDDENFTSFRQGNLTDHAVDSQHKKRRMSYEELEADNFHASFLSFGTDNRELPMDKERTPTASSRFLEDQHRDDFGNSFNSRSPAIAAKYSEQPYDLIKAADYRRPYSDDNRDLYSDSNRHASVDDRFLSNDIMKNEVGYHNARRPVITNERDSYRFERAGQTADDCEFLMNSKLGHKHHVDNGFAPVVPSESFETSPPRVRGTDRHRQLLMNERLIREHDSGRDHAIRFPSEKVTNPFDAHRREYDERRFPRDNLLKADYVDGPTGSGTLNVSSGYDSRIERTISNDFGFSKTRSINNGQHIGTLPRSVMSTKSSAFNQPHRSSVECFNEPFRDIQFPGFTTESQKFVASSSISHDAVVTRPVPAVSEFPGVHHERSLSFGAWQGASAAEELLPRDAGGHFLGLSKGISFEAEGSDRYNTSDFGNKVSVANYHIHDGCPTDEISSGMKSPSSDYRTCRFSPSALTSAPFTDSDNFNTRKSPFAFDDHTYVVSQGMQKYIPGRRNDEQKYIPERTNDEIYELLSPCRDSTELNIRYQEKDPINRHSEFYRGFRADAINANSQYYRSSEGQYSDIEKRRSVFTRLKSASKLYAQKEQEEDTDFYGASSVDEVMEMVHQNQNVRMKHQNQNVRMKHQNWNVRMKTPKKLNSLSKHNDREEEMESDIKKVSFNKHIEHGQSKILSVKMNKDANPVVDQPVDDMPKGTRMVEFKRRRENKKCFDDKSLESNLIKREDSESGENQETKKEDRESRENQETKKEDRQSGEDKETKGSSDKQAKRRKLVRPAFGQNDLIRGTTTN